MNIEMFIVFPGILITIGIGFLLLSIILVILAYKMDTKEQKILDQEYIIKENIYKPQDSEIARPIEPSTENVSIEISDTPQEIESDNEKESIEEEKIFKLPIKEEEKNEITGMIDKLDKKQEEPQENAINIFDEEFKIKNKQVKAEEKTKPLINNITIEEEEEIELL